MTQTQRRSLILIVGVMGGLLMAASAAFACNALTTIKFTSGDSAAAGSTVTARGFEFRYSEEPGAFTPVVVTFQSRAGEVLTEVPVNADGTIDFSFTAPDVAPGHYAIIASQFDAEGKPVPGSPARHTLEITGAAASGAAVAPMQASGGQSAPAAPNEAAPVAPAPAGAAEAPAPAPAPAPAQASVAQEPAATPPAAPAPQAAPTEPAAATPQMQAASTAPQAAAPSQPGAAGVSAPPVQEAAAPTPAATAEFPAALRATAVEQSAPAATPKQFTVPAVMPTMTEAASVPAPASAPAPAMGGLSAAWALAAAVVGLALATMVSTHRRRQLLGLAAARLF